MLSNHSFFALRNIRSRKKRSYLTMLGIVIGIVAIITLMMLGASLEKGISDRFDKFGTRRIFVGPKKINSIGGPPSGIAKLTQDDIDTMKRIPSIEYVTPIYVDYANVEFGREKKYVSVTSMETENLEKNFEDLDIKLEAGRWLSDEDNYGVVIGYGIAHELFDSDIKLKNSVKMEGKKFKVIGIKEKQGNQQDDYSMHIPIDSFREIKNNPGAISGITAMIKPGIDIEFAAQNIAKKLEKKRGDKNFQVTNPAKIKEQTGEMLGVIKMILIGIALISVIVGGVGIMNSMYTSVMERTKEIGVMKAIGAENYDITLIFIIESGLLGLIGGIIGTVIGVLLSFSIAGAITAVGWVTLPISFSFGVVIFSMIFSFVIGIASGTLPAIRAARLKPVDALRYE